MRDTVTVHGVVLKTQPIGEYDRRLVILTKERGRITAFARGARRPKSALIAATNPFVFAEFQLYEGRDSYTLAAADVREYFQDLAKKMPAVFYAYYILELADYYGREGVEASQEVNLIFVSLKALMKGTLAPDLIRGIYEIRMLVINGDYAIPKEPEEGRRGVWLALRYAAAAPPERLYAFTLDEETGAAFAKEAERALERVTDRQFRSLEVLADLKNGGI